MTGYLTTANLAEALRGTLRSAVVMIKTAAGPRPLRMVRGAHGNVRADGELKPLEGAASTAESVYLLMLMTERA
jgi:hypothetical protein